MAVFVVSVSGIAVSVSDAVVTTVGALVTFKLSYLYGVQKPDALPARRLKVVPAPDQRTAVAPVQYPFRWKLRVVDCRRTVSDDRRGRRKVATSDWLEQHVVQNTHVGDVAGDGLSLVGIGDDAMVTLDSDVRSRMMDAKRSLHEIGPVDTSARALFVI